ncbi:MAG: VanZ family protein [Thermodesulfobacteriota bacterium]
MRTTPLIPAAITLAIAPFAFCDPPLLPHTRFIDHLSDLGHLPLFFFLSLTVLRALERRSRPVRAAAALCLTLACAVAIEWIQQFLPNRNVSATDIANSTIGSILALLWFLPARRQPFAAAVVSGLLLLFSITPLATLVADHLLARRAFPLLFDFERGGEMQRVSGSARCRIVGGHAAHGEHSLQLQLDTRQYSGVSFRYFPQDWRRMSALLLEVDNPQPQPVTVHVRIHDQRHDADGMRYQDRFNRTLALAPGRNAIRLPLADVRHGPKNRKLDLGQVAGIGLFVMREPRPLTLYLDHLRLE